MINAVSVTNHFGKTLRCVLEDPESSGFSITNIDGLTPGKSTVNIKDIATLDGGFFQRARLPARNIVLTYIFMDYIDGQYRSIEEARQTFYQYYVVKKTVKLEIETDSHKYVISGVVESNEPSIFSSDEGAQVSVLCPDPYFRLADSGISEEGSMSEVVFNPNGEFMFPFSNEFPYRRIKFGSNDEHITENTVNIIYSGDVDTGIILRTKITGTFNGNYIDFEFYGDSAENPKITELSFGDILWRAAGGGLQLGDELVISTIPGNKYAVVKRGSQTINVFPYIQVLPSWISLQKGDNIIKIKPGYILPSYPNVYITLEYPILYLGV